MGNILQKLTSRKLWMAIAGIATGIAMVVGVDGSELTSIAGGVVALISSITYIIMEGKIDAEGVKNTIIAIQDSIDAIEGGDQE